jgi:hypothetical protein
MNTLGDLVMFALSCSLMIRDIECWDGTMTLVVVPFIVDTTNDITNNVELLESTMNTLEKQCGRSKEWKKTAVFSFWHF